MTLRTVARLAAGPALLLATPAIAQVDILDYLDSRYAETESIAMTLWDLAEVGYQEVESSRLLQDIFH